jgi:hypothetical protein
MLVRRDPARSRGKALTQSAASGNLPRAAHRQGTSMTITLAHVAPLVALLAGILILIMPRLLNFIVAIYLIFIGVTGLWPRLLH